MSVSSLKPFLQRSVLLQLGLVLLFWTGGEAVVRLLKLPLPGGVVGLALVLLMLATRVLNLGTVKRGADWLLAQMMLFFVPAVLAVLDHREFLGWLGLKILLVIVLSTGAVMGVTAFVVDQLHRGRDGDVHAAPQLR